MESTSSFIPQSNPHNRPKKRGRRRIYIISYVIYALFFGVLLVVVGMFAWELQLQSQLEVKKAALVEQRQQFNQGDIERVRELADQLELARVVMDGHPAVTRLIAALEDTTLETIQLTDFSVARTQDGDDTVVVSFSGAVDSFDAVLFQQEVLASNNILAEAEIIDVTYQEAAIGDSQDIFIAPTPITYNVQLAVPISSIAYTGANAPRLDPLTQESSEVVETAALDQAGLPADQEIEVGESDAVIDTNDNTENF